MGIFERKVNNKTAKKIIINKKKRDFKLLKTPRSRRLGMLILFYLLSLLVMATGYMSRSQSITLGLPSPTNITASSNVSYESEILTERAIEEAVANISPVMAVDSQALNQIDEVLVTTFEEVRTKRDVYQEKIAAYLAEQNAEDSSVDIDSKEYNQAMESILSSISILDMPIKDKNYILEIDDVDLDMIEDYTRSLIRKYMKAGVQSSGISIARNNMLEEVMSSTLPSKSKSLITSVIEQNNLIETLKYDDYATSQRREEIVSEVEPVVENIVKGQVLASEGEIISPLTYERIKHSDTSVREETYLGILGIAILLLVLYGIILWFLYQYRPEVPEQENYLQLIVVLLLFGLLASEVFARITFTSGNEMLFFYMTPIAAIGILTSILLDNEMGLMVSSVLSILLGITAGFAFEYTLVAMVASYIGVFSVAKVGHRSDLMKSAIYMGGINILTITALSWFLNYSGSMTFWAVAMGVVGAFLSSVLAIGILPFFELVFKITTPVRLLEFSDPNQPLLRRLLMEAPGTYHHSIMVSNLSEAAAEAVGADRLLARVGAFYHDIGKIKRPYFFIENQQGMEENPHDKLSPRLSTLVITSHVKDGLDLANEYNLPPSIQQFIATHHGDSLVRFFYNKAKEIEGEDINEREFHYDGKKPVSKEAAIVMLADTVEASVRSLKNPNPGRVEGFVRKVIKEKFEEEQLSESQLTFRELEIIARAFIRILSGIYHQRVEYPEKLAKEVQRRQTQDESDYHEQTK